MENEHVKQAFSKVKQDIFSSTKELYKLKFELSEIKLLIRNLHEDLNNQKLYELAKKPYFISPTHNPTHQTDKPTDLVNPTHNPTHQQEIKGLKSQNLAISTGNEGVPTDRQTDRQTNQQTDNSIENNLQEASEILNSLDKIKREIRSKFKRITPQEMAVFSTIYQLEEQDPENTTYRQVAKALKLSESSIRDYTKRIIAKGIPIKKHKLNNKKILLSISQELKKIATLPTILQLREL